MSLNATILADKVTRIGRFLLHFTARKPVSASLTSSIQAGIPARHCDEGVFDSLTPVRDASESGVTCGAWGRRAVINANVLETLRLHWLAGWP